MPEDTRRRSFEHGPVESTVSNKLKALIIAAADQNQSNGQLQQHHKNTTGIIGQRNWSDDDEVNKIWEKYSKPAPNEMEAVQEGFVRHVVTTLARTHFNMDNYAGYQAAAYTIRDQLLFRWDQTQQHHTQVDQKRVYYLSLEFLMGRSLGNAILNLGLKGIYGEALKKLGVELEELVEKERDAALGNGGLGRLAACFMDSMATMDYPAWGYGIRYTYGIFKQQIIGGCQVEFPDYWLTFGNPWEVPRTDVVYEVGFYGHVNKYTDGLGRERYAWISGETVEAVAYDVPIPGYDTKNTINIRLWSSKPKKEFDLKSFNEGNYQKSVEEQQKAENITSVLYPNDNTMAGKELRLKQQYFFVCATLQDIIRRFKKTRRAWTDFPEQVAIQLNDTHPAISIPELMRIFVDEEGMEWDQAWDIVTRVYSFTNHTVLPEAMEKWPVSMVSALLPRHMQIIYDINLFFLQSVEAKFPGDRSILTRLSIIEESPYQQVRMAFLAVVGCHTVNGVAAIHSELIKTTIFSDFVRYFGPDKFQNKTNGITPRRWLHQANPDLSALITRILGSEAWLKDLDRLQGLAERIADPVFLKHWQGIKLANKVRLAQYIRNTTGLQVDPEALFDVQVKRIHEYKRQLMNILGVIHRYLKLVDMDEAKLADVVPRVFIFGGKAAPGYYMAKLVIKLINDVADVVNRNPRTNKWLKVVFLADYNVSLAELIVPASDISEHISTAGTEASGTSNMKFALNGGLIIGTLDGANIEIREEIGEENMFIFGARAEEVEDIRHNQRYRNLSMNPDLARVIEAIKLGMFGDFTIFAPLIDTLTIGGDYYLLSHDFASYLDAHDRIDRCYRDQSEWTQKSILSTARMGKFSSDRSIREYAQQIWHIQPCAPPKDL